MSSEDSNTPSSSPSDRRRKRSVVFNNHPYIEEVESVEKAVNNNNDTTEVEAIVHEENERYESSRNSDSETDASSENTHNNTLHEQGDLKHGFEAEKHDSKDHNGRHVEQSLREDDIAVPTNVNDTTTKNEHLNTNGIEYDETKPRRLPKLHLDTNQQPSRALRDSINYLISPDEPEGDSPGRHRRRQNSGNLVSSESEPNFRSDREHYDRPRHGSEARVMADGNLYQRSPEFSRRRLSKNTSPVQKYMVKTASPSTAHRTKRKMSSDARLGATHERLHTKLPPKRKISSDARLVGHAFNIEERQNMPAIDDVRKRKVSFDTTALVNGNRMMPLNDEIILPQVSEHMAHEHTKDPSVDRFYLPDEHVSDSPQDKLPTVYITTEDEETHETSTRVCNYDETNVDPFDRNEAHSAGYENRAYIADDEESICSNTSDNRMDYDEESQRYQSNGFHHQTAYDQPAVIPHTNTNYGSALNGKKLSSSSLPAGLGYRNLSPAQSIEDGMGPKSILKVRREDTDSMVSQESVEKKFKVRKDSIALFTSKHGQVELQQIRQEYQSGKGFACSDIKELWATRHDLFTRYKLHLLVLMLFSLTFTFVVVGLHLHSVHHEELAIAKKIFFNAKNRRLSLHDQSSSDTFRGTLGKDIPLWMSPTHCFQNYKEIHDQTCLRWKGHAELDIEYYKYKNLQCYNVTWSLDGNTAAHDCFDLGGSYWYGPVNSTDGVWPISKSNFTYSVTKSKHYGSGTFSAATEYYWISSKGWVILFDSNYPVEISWNKHVKRAMCVKVKQRGDFYQSVQPVSKFSYTMCNGDDIRDAHITIRQRYFPKLNDIPNRYLLDRPHWSTVSESESFQLNSSTITNLAKTISENELTCGTLELDGKWEAIYGDLTFKRNSFPNMTDLISDVNKYECDISLNIYPFFSYLSHSFQEGVRHHYFVMDIGRTVPALLKWEHGVGAMVDISNTAARDWVNGKIQNLISQYNIKTFRLNYGKDAWIPHNPQFKINDMNPNKVKRFFTDMISSHGDVVLQSTSQSQDQISIIGIESTIIKQGKRFCLRNLIPDIINYGLMGYPFVMADGLGFDKTINADDVFLPSRDIFIRWMQFSFFLPAIKFTTKPWSYDDEVVSAARNLSVFHEKKIVDLIHSEREDILNGMPIIRPLWWNEPNERMSFKLDDEFLLSNQYLVAPILCEAPENGDMAERDIYVPDGVWRDMISDKIIIGPRMIKNYKVAQYMVPYFERLPEYGEM